MKPLPVGYKWGIRIFSALGMIVVIVFILPIVAFVSGAHYGIMEIWKDSKDV